MLLLCPPEVCRFAKQSSLGYKMEIGRRRSATSLIDAKENATHANQEWIAQARSTEPWEGHHHPFPPDLPPGMEAYEGANEVEEP